MESIARYINTLLFLFCLLIGNISAQEYHANGAVSANTVEKTVAEADSDSVPMQKRDSISFSVITCTPGADVYAKFGHTALRMINHSTREDVVFNYGCFNYNSENFLFKFILGQTDYLLEAEPTESFLYRYSYMGNGVMEQVVNLTADEADKLRAMLFENLLPENQEYRYKWIGNNCTDKAKYMIEDAIDGKVLYNFSNIKDDPTVRDILHRCLEQTPWVSFGVDLLLGHEIDNGLTFFKKNNTEESHRLKMFIPARFMEAANNAFIERANGTKVSYIKETHQLVEAVYEEGAPSLLTPTIVFGVLLAIVLFFCFVDLKRKILTLWLDVILLISQGLTGMIISFLFFFSEHPAVDSNWLVIIFNPIPLFYAIWLVICKKKRLKNHIAHVNLAVLALFLLTMLLCPQSFNIATYLMVLSLLSRAYVNSRLASILYI